MVEKSRYFHQTHVENKKTKLREGKERKFLIN